MYGFRVVKVELYRDPEGNTQAVVHVADPAGKIVSMDWNGVDKESLSTWISDCLRTAEKVYAIGTGQPQP